jgi:tRNA (cmo5U34)-methyltransferase
VAWRWTRHRSVRWTLSRSDGAALLSRKTRVSHNDGVPRDTSRPPHRDCRHDHRGLPNEGTDTVGNFRFDPSSYDDKARENVEGYDEFQELVAAMPGDRVGRVLDLGAGTGATSSVVVRHHPEASLVLLDSSAEMLAVATASLPSSQVEAAVVGDLVDAFPDSVFDRVVSALAIHHLESERKRALFAKIHAALEPGGVFMMGDLVVPDDPAEEVMELTPDHDRPDRLIDLLAWLDAAGFDASVEWTRNDLVVVRAVTTRT